MNEIDLLRTQLRQWNLYGEIPMSNGREHVVQENPYSVTMRRASTKGGPQTVHAESMLEHDFFCILDFDQRVEKYKEQAVVVPWIDSKGRFRRYTPDVLVKFSSSEHQEDQAHVLSTIFEIKPYPVVKQNWTKLAEKIRGIKKTLDGTGVEFKLVTERQIQPTFLKNVRFLLDYDSKKLINDQRLTDSQHARMMRVRESIPKVGVTTPRLILNSITNDVIEQAYLVPWIWNFLRGGSLQADLITPLTMDTEVWDEQIVGQVISEYWLTPEKRSYAHLHREIQRRCRAAKVPSPSLPTVVERANRVDPIEATKKRQGRAQSDKLKLIEGTVPNVDRPYSVIQIDHTLVDIELVDSENRVSIGRPWITIAIDVYTEIERTQQSVFGSFVQLGNF